MGEAAAGWLVLGVALHLGNQVARGRGWYALLRTACDPAPGLRRRDAIAGWIAGAGAGGLASARGGDAVRVLLLRRRAPEAGCPLLAGTLVAEGAGEIVAVLAGAALAILALLALARRLPRVRRVTAGVARGCAPLRAPADYALRVLPWQLASRA